MPVRRGSYPDREGLCVASLIRVKLNNPDCPGKPRKIAGRDETLCAHMPQLASDFGFGLFLAPFRGASRARMRRAGEGMYLGARAPQSQRDGKVRRVRDLRQRGRIPPKWLRQNPDRLTTLPRQRCRGCAGIADRSRKGNRSGDRFAPSCLLLLHGRWPRVFSLARVYT